MTKRRGILLGRFGTGGWPVVTATSLGQAALELLFPSRCLGCGRSGTFLCEACAGRLTPALPPRCSHCWEPRSLAGECLACQLHPPAFDALRAAFVYDGLARDLVQPLKSRGVPAPAGRRGGRRAGAPPPCVGREPL